jgi:uncharacterized protein (TIGR00730 family)
MHTEKSWTDLKAESSWMIFKIMSEFVDGFEKLNKIGPCVSIFGSARTQPGTELYETTSLLARRLTEEGYGIITGGGPGVMEAANKGAFEGGGKSVGLNIDLPMEQFHNPFIDSDKLITFRFFFVRKVMFVKYAQAFVMMPGGFGTMDETFEVLTLIQTLKINKIPVILYGSEFWKGLLDWIEGTMLKKYNHISPDDLDLVKVTDSVEEAVEIIRTFYIDEHRLSPNF